MAPMKYFYELTVSSSPHAHGKQTTQTIMRDVLIALLPALVGAVYFFGFRALVVTVVSAAACVFFEWAYRKLLKLDSTVWDLSAVVTGVLVAYVCPVTVPLWMIIIGDFFAIVIVKQLFGGIGQNFVNPALAGRAFMFISWAGAMGGTWAKPGFSNAVGLFQTTLTDATSAATPLGAMHAGNMPDCSVLDAFLGNVGGCLGETSVALLLLGGLYLVARRVISCRIPLAFMATVFVLGVLFPQGNDPLTWGALQLCTGGVALGAIFMATDYVTSPVTKLGQIIFGIGCGVITIVIRYFGSFPEGVSFAILVMNTCVVLLDMVGRPKKFGAPKKEAKK